MTKAKERERAKDVLGRYIPVAMGVLEKHGTLPFHCYMERGNERRVVLCEMLPGSVMFMPSWDWKEIATVALRAFIKVWEPDVVVTCGESFACKHPGYLPIRCAARYRSDALDVLPMIAQFRTGPVREWVCTVDVTNGRYFDPNDWLRDLDTGHYGGNLHDLFGRKLTDETEDADLYAEGLSFADGFSEAVLNDLNTGKALVLNQPFYLKVLTTLLDNQRQELMNLVMGLMEKYDV